MVADFATSRINRTAGIVMKTFFRSGKDKMKSVKEDASRKCKTKVLHDFVVPYLTSDLLISCYYSYSHCKYVGTRSVFKR